MKPLLIIIGGPTGVGKTYCAIELAKKLNCEIISADSRQIFKEMSIGTAVPSVNELAKVKHHFIQHVSVTGQYNASIFEKEVIEKLNSIFKTQKLAIMVGGSGMYIDAVCKGIDELPDIPFKVREKYKELYNKKGLEKIQQLVKKKDPEYYEKVDTNNPTRLLKALEVYEVTKKPYSKLLKNKHKKRDFRQLMIVLDMPRNELYERINKRVDIMFENGLEDEVTSLQHFKNLTPLNTVGYKELFKYLSGDISVEEAIEQIKNHSRAYARRQLTWFRRYKDAIWFKPDELDSMYKTISKEIINANK